MAAAARILYEGFVDDKQSLALGGAQNYIYHLAQVLLSIGIRPIVYQSAKAAFSVEIDGCEVRGVAGARSSKDVLRAIGQGEHDYDNDLLIFGTDFLICKNAFRHSVAIQHGVAWDITRSRPASDLQNCAAIFKGAFRALKKYLRYRHCENLVCVDYNFINWYRTQVASVGLRCFMIPNFALACEEGLARAEGGPVSVVFARRLVPYRGTRLFAEAIRPLLEKYPELRVTVAGTGPDEVWMKKALGGFKNVSFTSYSVNDGVRFHSAFDIAVVPTRGSEGTSLSLLEAMSAGCAVVATNVGGMTNIVLDGFNGRLISPDADELRNTIEELILDPQKRAFLAAHAAETVRTSFSHEKWAEAWKKAVRTILEQ